MGDEPMEEDDSFCQPVPFSAPFVRRSLPTVSEDKDDDPDSDDSFDNFAATQSTVESSAKSTASSTQSGGETKPSIPGPSSVQPNVPFPRPSFVKKTAQKPSPFQLTQQVAQRPAPSPRIPPRPPPENSQKIHPVVRNTIANDIGNKMKTPMSPNSLSRHRSANSGLRNNFLSPPIRGIQLNTKLSPIDPRPSTPSGEIKMLRDMLDNEKQKVQKLQVELQKDVHSAVEKHRREMEQRDALLKEKEKEIEMLKTSLACQKGVTSKASNVVTKSPAIPAILAPPVSTSSSAIDVKKVYPKLPLDPLRKTPHRPPQLPGSGMSAFRHPTKEEEDDTFQLDASFEPSATSTPKVPGILRSSIRRPFPLEDPIFGRVRGEPTPKRRTIFDEEEEERKTWTMEEIHDQMRNIWAEMEDSESTFRTLFPEIKKITVDVKMEEEADGEDEMQWLDGCLARRVRTLTAKKEEKSRPLNAKAKTKMIQQAELCPVPDTSCSKCRLDERAPRGISKKNDEKEWEAKETQRVSLAKKGAEEMRMKQYADLLMTVSTKGIGDLQQKKANVERQYEERTCRIQKRSLEDVRESKKDEWRTSMMSELRENGEMEAQFDKDGGRSNEDFIWTSDSEDEDWEFPSPYNRSKQTLCSGCHHRQKVQRRRSKRERERRKLKIECLKEYGVELREKLRNMSILTKSKIEAAENELNRHVDEVLAGCSRVFDEEDEDLF